MAIGSQIPSKGLNGWLLKPNTLLFSLIHFLIILHLGMGGREAQNLEAQVRHRHCKTNRSR
jgi:hypothetical protein